jgi:hypothetical protein
MGWANSDLGEELSDKTGDLLEWVSRPTPRADRALRQFGIPTVMLEACFERRLPPPAAYLRHVIENPHTMTWPRDEASTGAMRLRREELFGHYGPERAAAAHAEALGELEKVGAAGSGGKWWAFEGFTCADCLLETENLFVLIEGKRTEKLALSTRWKGQRNQLLRNLEVVGALARQRGKEYAVILMTEEFTEGLPMEAVGTSLGHLPADDREDLLDHYLGCVPWKDALAEVFFPYTVADAARRMREAQAENPLSAIA